MREMIKTNITEMFGIKYPIIAAPMGPFYTTELTVAVSEAGGMGVLSHTNLEDKSSIKEMINNIEYVVEHTDKPFGINIRTSRMQPDARQMVSQIPKYLRKNQKAREQLKYMLTSAGSASMLPKSKQFQALKEMQPELKHFHVAPALWLAEKSVQAGVDGLVVTGTEGGGHQSYEKVSSLVVLQECLEKFPDIPIVACGGFATGRSVAAALTMGAGAVAMGSRFIASNESEFHENYKNVIPPAKSTDTILVTGVFGPIRLWKNKYALSHGLVEDREAKMAQEASMSPEDLLKEQKHYELVYHGDIEDGAVLLGQSIGLMDSIKSASDIIEEIMSDTEKCLKATANLIQ